MKDDLCEQSHLPVLLHQARQAEALRLLPLVVNYTTLSMHASPMHLLHESMVFNHHSFYVRSFFFVFKQRQQSIQINY